MTATFQRLFALSVAESKCSLEAQELIVSILLDTHAELVWDLETRMASDEIETTTPEMRLSELKTILEREYRWALDIDFTSQQAQHHFWYYSEEKDEPRRGGLRRTTGRG